MFRCLKRDQGCFFSKPTCHIQLECYCYTLLLCLFFQSTEHLSTPRNLATLDLYEISFFLFLICTWRAPLFVRSTSPASFKLKLSHLFLLYRCRRSVKIFVFIEEIIPNLIYFNLLKTAIGYLFGFVKN